MTVLGVFLQTRTYGADYHGYLKEPPKKVWPMLKIIKGGTSLKNKEFSLLVHEGTGTG